MPDLVLKFYTVVEKSDENIERRPTLREFESWKEVWTKEAGRHGFLVEGFARNAARPDVREISLRHEDSSRFVTSAAIDKLGRSLDRLPFTVNKKRMTGLWLIPSPEMARQ